MKITKLCPREDLGFCNCYVIGEEGSPCVIVDPGYNGNDFLSRYVEKHHQGRVLGFLLTHGHYDHIYGLTNYPNVASIPVFCDENEVEMLKDPSLNLSYRHDIGDIDLENINVYPLEDEDEIKLGDMVFQVVETPFHTKGSVCFLLKEEDVCFSGDTLFHLGIGRSDLPTGSSRTVESSLEKLKKTFKETTKVYPGHGPSTTFGNELRMNPYL